MIKSDLRDCKKNEFVHRYIKLKIKVFVWCLKYVKTVFNNYAPNFEKVDGAYCFWSVRAWVTLFVPTVTFKPLKLES